MVEVGYLVALPIAPALLSTWQEAGGPLDGPGVPHTPPWVTQSGHVVQTFANEHLIGREDQVIRVPRDIALVADGIADLGDATGGPASDPTTQATMVPFERGAVIVGKDDVPVGLPRAVVDTWLQLALAGQPLGLPIGIAAGEAGATTTVFGFQFGDLAFDRVAGTVQSQPPTQEKKYFFFPSTPRHLRAGVPGTRATPFIGGDTALPQMLRSIQRASAAGSTGYIYLANWHCNVDLPLTLSGVATTLGDELAQAIRNGCQVRALLWSGLAGLQLSAPIVGPLEAMLGSLFHAQAKMNQRAQSFLTSFAGDIRVALDDKTLPWGSAHQKVLIVFDGQTVEAWVGGIEWNSDRLGPNSNGRPLFDTAVRLEGPGGFEVLQSWLDRWAATTGESGLRGESTSTASAVGTVSAQVTHTYGPGCPFVPRITTAADAITNALSQARSFFYMEDQYFCGNARLQKAILSALRNGTTGVLVITNDELDDQPDGIRQRQPFLQLLQSQSQGRLHIYERLGDKNGTLAPDGSRAYVHSKLLIVDDDVCLIGSVNSNHRGWSHDTEIMVTLQDSQGPGGTGAGQRGFARELRCRLWGQHLALSPDQLGDPTQDIQTFISRAGAVQAGTALSLLRVYDANASRPLAIGIPVLGLPLQPLVDAAFPVIIDPE
jgi:phosphatidylserine/phosphatidylglycerophosphate/cardiolipin synthase-like enzyme